MGLPTETVYGAAACLACPEALSRLRRACTPPDTRPLGVLASDPAPETAVESNFTRDGFMAAVEKAKDYITAGDIIQVVLSQRLQRELSPALREQPFNLYRALRYLNPSPYM